MRRVVATLAAISAAALIAFACGDEGSSSSAAEATSWQRIPDVPLSPREGALGLWTGQEALLIGGSDARPCPPAASCAPPEVPPLADGAAFDPRTGSWREIADAPTGFALADGYGAEGAVVGRTAYVLVPGERGRPGSRQAFLAYRIDRDHWEELPPPPLEHGRRRNLGLDYSIAAAGDRIVAFRRTDEGGESPDFAFNPRTASWSELPPDPLSRSFDRAMARSGDQLVLFAKALGAGGDDPSFVRAAALDLETGSWRRLPDSQVLDMEATGRWFEVDGRLVNPAIGRSDGRGRRDRAYPEGGVLDPARGEWSELPDRPDEADQPPTSSGVLTASGGHYYDYRGWILGATADRWTRIPQLDDEAHITSRTVVAAGDDLLVFGGARWGRAAGDRNADDEELPQRPRAVERLLSAWIWSPPQE